MTAIATHTSLMTGRQLRAFARPPDPPGHRTAAEAIRPRPGHPDRPLAARTLPGRHGCVFGVYL